MPEGKEILSGVGAQRRSKEGFVSPAQIKTGGLTAVTGAVSGPGGLE